MVQDKAGITGNVLVVVRGPDGKIKRFPQTRLEKLKGKPGKPMVCENHNIVTSEGDALIVDALSTTPARTVPNEANAVIGVGTGFTAENKASDALITQTGSDEQMDSGFPQQKGTWAQTEDSVLVFKATFEAGDLDDTGIDEALLGTATDTLAYAEITTPVNVTTSDTLEVTWELTFLGA
jgi:hypothetical protein